MSKYSALDAHSRNCPSCIRQREAEGHQTPGTKKKTSLPPCSEARKASSSRVSLVRRSNSCLSSLDGGEKMVGREGSFEGGTHYLTPTQRKNQELKRCRADLAKANEKLETKDLEIRELQRELRLMKDSRPDSMARSWGEGVIEAETGSVTDSGNCEELSVSFGLLDQDSQRGEGMGDNIDFELMETALREEEEARYKLEEENKNLKDQLKELKTELKLKDGDAEKDVDSLARNESKDFSIQEENLHHDNETTADLENEIKNKLEKELRNQITSEFMVKEEEKNKRTEELAKDLNETTTRCVRQQEMIEQLQQRHESMTKELEYLRHETKEKVASSKKLGLEKLVQTEGEDLEEVNLTEEVVDPRTHYTLQFLRRSVYYFLTDRENRGYHLKSIERLLEFTEAEKESISRGKNLGKMPTQERY